jgi:hypothetical protein
MVDAARIILEILSPLQLVGRQDGANVLQLWKTHLPEFLPDHIGNWEPIDRPFDPDNLNAALDSWRWPFLAAKKRPKVNCSIWMRKNAARQLHSTLIWEFYERLDAQHALLAFLKTAAPKLNADFACLHLLTASEIERSRANKTVTAIDKKATQFNFFLASKDLKRRIPDLYWATVLGKPYVNMFGKEQLLSTPVYRAEALSQEMVLLQLSKELSDVSDPTDKFSSARQRAVLYLGETAFFRPSAEAAGSYHAPEFAFE